MPHHASSDPSDAAGECQRQAFQHQLAYDSAPRSPQSRAYRHLTSAYGGAGQQHMGDIGAGDQQHQQDRA